MRAGRGFSPEVQTFLEHQWVCPAQRQNQTRGPGWLELLIATSWKPDQTKSHQKRGQTGGRAHGKGSDRVRGKTPPSLLKTSCSFVELCLFLYVTAGPCPQNPPAHTGDSLWGTRSFGTAGAGRVNEFDYLHGAAGDLSQLSHTLSG